jgi:hypothetical protein
MSTAIERVEEFLAQKRLLGRPSDPSVITGANTAHLMTADIEELVRLAKLAPDSYSLVDGDGAWWTYNRRYSAWVVEDGPDTPLREVVPDEWNLIYVGDPEVAGDRVIEQYGARS